MFCGDIQRVEKACIAWELLALVTSFFITQYQRLSLFVHKSENKLTVPENQTIWLFLLLFQRLNIHPRWTRMSLLLFQSWKNTLKTHFWDKFQAHATRVVERNHGGSWCIKKSLRRYLCGPLLFGGADSAIPPKTWPPAYGKWGYNYHTQHLPSVSCPRWRLIVWYCWHWYSTCQ